MVVDEIGTLDTYLEGSDQWLTWMTTQTYITLTYPISLSTVFSIHSTNYWPNISNSDGWCSSGVGTYTTSTCYTYFADGKGFLFVIGK